MITLSMQLFRDYVQAELAQLRANQEVMMYSLNVQLPGYKLSLEPSDDEDHLDPTPSPLSVQSRGAAAPSSSIPPSGGKGQILTTKLVSEAKTVRWAGIHIPPSEW